jgi:hypothetical protein
MAQPYIFKGVISDQESKETLAFVNISPDGGKTGWTSNIDGHFRIETSTPFRSLSFYYVGYEPKAIIVNVKDFDNELQVKLTKKVVELGEIRIKSGENPAWRIINRVIKNRDINNPEKVKSFSYTSYNKMFFTLQEDTTLKRRRQLYLPDTLLRDSSDMKLNSFLKKNNLLLMEFVTERNFKRPDQNNEKVISSRISGFTDPSFTLLATQMQSFAFYSDFITLLNKKYLNPVSTGSTRRYSFQLQDTFLTEAHDTLYVISFKPQKPNNFDLLQGVLYINTNGYAIQNVIAEPCGTDNRFAVRIQQRYEKIDNKQWFPTQLNTDLLFKRTTIKSGLRELYLIGIGKSYLWDIKIDPDLSHVKFSNISVSASKDANKPNDSIWYSYRPIPLTAKDSATYHVVDSLGHAQNFDQKLQSIESITSGYIPYKLINIDCRKFFTYNPYEGVRLGLGLATNQKAGTFFSLGGFFAYGFHDKELKYGSFLELFPHWYSDTKLTIKYNADIYETSTYSFFDDLIIHSSELWRGFLINQMDWIRDREAAFSFRALQYFKVNLYLNQSRKEIPDYAFAPPTLNPGFDNDDFQFTEAGFQVKFGYSEKFALAPSGRKLSLGTNYPMLWFNFKRGFSVLGGQYEYTKYEFKLSKSFMSKRFGKSKIALVAGKAIGDIPLCNLYNGHGSYLPFSLEAENSFGTMRMSEFYSDEFVSLFLKQDFGGLIFSRPKFRPELNLVTNIGFGSMANPSYHQLVTFKSMEKGYFESGIVFNRVLNMGLIGYGAAVFYRYGPYAFTNVRENFSYKLTISFNI